MLIPVGALHPIAASANDLIVAIVFFVLWRQILGRQLLAFGLSFAAAGPLIFLLGFDVGTGRSAWRSFVTDGLLIAAALLLFAGCMLLTQPPHIFGKRRTR